MGMYDTVYDVPIKCPKCGDESGKEVQIKSGPQSLSSFKFGVDKIPLDWDYTYYGSVVEKIDEENGKIGGIAECKKCRARVFKKMEEIANRFRKEGRMECPEKKEGEDIYLFECEIDGKNALKVVLEELDKTFNSGSESESFFEVVISVKDGIPIYVEIRG